MTMHSRGDFHGETLTAREVAGFVFREMLHPPGAAFPSIAISGPMWRSC